jgi:putative ABC transport system permease protein
MFNFLIETFLLGLKNLRLHKLRSLLTALGIIIGVAAVIIMVAIGEGSKQQALEQLKQLGAENILVRSKKPPESSDSSSKQQRILDYGLERTDLVRLKELPGVKKVVALRDTEQRVIRGPLQLPQGTAIGTEPEFFDIINLRADRGHFFDKLQYDRADAVCVLGAFAAKHLFPHEEPLGQTIQLGTKAFGSVMVTIVGVLEPTGLRAGSDAASIVHLDPDQGAYIPLTLARAIWHDTVLKRQAGTFERKEIELSEIWLQAGKTEDVERLASIAQNIIESSHGDRGDFEIKAPIQILRAAEQTQRMFNFIMVGIASFALLVGGIGIMNIMLASVTERTKEIGIRRALGAKRRHITLQFLIETTVISLTGGVIGILLGAGVARAIPWLALKFSSQSYPTSIAQWSVIGSFMVSGLIGIGFGMYPAIMAARMNPIEALRHE